jgi:CheY-like chemotaxis protein
MTLQSKSTILVAEDQMLVRMEAVDALIDHGYDVLEVGDADEAFAMLKSRSGGIQLLFTDIQMPGLVSGLKLAQDVRRYWPAIGLLMTSGGQRPSVAELPEGSHYIPKAYDLQQVIVHLGELAAAR